MNLFAPYRLLVLSGILLTAILWIRLARRDHRLFLLYLGALGGAFMGAKIVYLAAEGWLHFGQPDQWLQWATGKSILGALLGGYLAVELVKKLIKYRAPTGDFFAMIAPFGIILGRFGCLAHGCCLGVICQERWFTLADHAGHPRWPAVPAEIAFNVLALLSFAILRMKKFLPGQHFHLYLISYGLFRFVHEFWRDTPAIVAGRVSGYALAALAVFFLGVFRFFQRQNSGTDRINSPLLVEDSSVGNYNGP